MTTAEKPGEIADAAARSGSDAAQARVRRWWRLLPQLLTRPTAVFVALRDDDEADVDARSEPILAIVILAGMAGILLTPAWATLLDEESLDWLVLAVVTFIGGLFYGRPATSCSASSCWLGARGVGLDTPRPAGAAARRRSRRCRLRSRSWSTVAAIVLALRLRLVQDRGLGRRHGPDSSSLGDRVSRSRSGRSACWPLGLRTTFELPWRGVVGALALAAVHRGAFAVRAVGALASDLRRGPPGIRLRATPSSSASNAASSSAGIP